MTFSRPLTVLVHLFILCVILGGTPACERQSNAPADDNKPVPEQTSRIRAPANTGDAAPAEHPAWPLGRELLDTSAGKASELRAAIDQLLARPTIDNLELAQRLWRETASSLEHFHLFSRLGTVAPQDFQKLVDLQFNLTAWPIQPGYLDGFGDHPYSGIVFDIGVPITPEVLREQHGMTDNSDATLGVYAMEFLLFGENNDRGPLVFQPITALDDKAREDGYTSVDELPRNRRRELLRLQAQLLTEDINHLKDTWLGNQPGQIQYLFNALGTKQQTELWQKAALALATEQLVSVAEQKPSGAKQELWQGQQLADRLGAQLYGLQRFNEQVPLGAQAATEIRNSIESMNAVRKLPPLDERGLPPRIDWQSAYASLRQLVAALNPPQSE